MIVVIKQNVSKEQVERLVHRIEDMGLAIHRSDGASTTILGLMGDTSRVDERTLLAYDAVEYVRRVTEPYKAVNRKMHPDDTILEVAGRIVKIVGIAVSTFLKIDNLLHQRMREMVFEVGVIGIEISHGCFYFEFFL